MLLLTGRGAPRARALPPPRHQEHLSLHEPRAPLQYDLNTFMPVNQLLRAVGPDAHGGYGADGAVGLGAGHKASNDCIAWVNPVFSADFARGEVACGRLWHAAMVSRSRTTLVRGAWWMELEDPGRLRSWFPLSAPAVTHS